MGEGLLFLPVNGRPAAKTTPCGALIDQPIERPFGTG